MIQIGIADTLRKKVSAMFDTKYLKINNLTERCKANGFASLCAVGDLMRLAVCVDYAQKYTLPFYEKREYRCPFFTIQWLIFPFGVKIMTIRD